MQSERETREIEHKKTGIIKTGIKDHWLATTNQHNTNQIYTFIVLLIGIHMLRDEYYNFNYMGPILTDLERSRY